MLATLEIINASKEYKAEACALSGVSAALTPGLHVVLGPNGAGKTTLLRLLAGIIQPSGGQVLFNMRDINGDFSYKQNLGYMPQELGFYPDMTGRAFLRYMAGLKGIPAELSPVRVEAVAKIAGLGPYLERFVGGWSAGLKRRLGIAQALLSDPDVLILDEPLVGLSPEEKLFFWDYFVKLASCRIVIVSSNTLTDFVALADRVLVLVKGELKFNGRVDDFIRLADGKVWVAAMPAQAAERLPAGAAISGMQFGDSCRARIISEGRPNVAGAEPSEPEPADAYAWLVNGGHIGPKE